MTLLFMILFGSLFYQYCYFIILKYIFKSQITFAFDIYILKITTIQKRIIENLKYFTANN